MRTKVYFNALVLLLIIVGCATTKPSNNNITSKTDEKVGEVLGTSAIEGKLYLILRQDAPATFSSSELGVSDSEIPKQLLINPMFQYELIRKGTDIGITGTFPVLSVTQSSSAYKIKAKLITIIPRRHVERFIASGQESATFKLSDP